MRRSLALILSHSPSTSMAQRSKSKPAKASGKTSAASVNSPVLPSYIQETPTAYLIQVRVKPGAKRSGITSIDADCVSLQIDAPPVDGEANAAVVEFVSEVLQVRRGQVQLARGHKQREKTLEITKESINVDLIIQRFNDFLKAESH